MYVTIINLKRANLKWKVIQEFTLQGDERRLSFSKTLTKLAITKLLKTEFKDALYSTEGAKDS